MFLSVFACVPPEDPSAESSGSLLSSEEVEERNQECDLYLSFAHTNLSNREYEDAIENFNEVINLGCSDRNSEDIFSWMGRAYIEQGKNDSASFIFKKGMKYLDSNSEFLEVYAWNEGKLNKVDNQIYLLEKQLTLDETNVNILEKLSDIYSENGDFKEQLNILSLWLKIDPENQKATGEKKVAYGELGMDESTVDRERWEQNPSNIQYGLEYVNGLMEQGQEEEMVSVLKELLTYDRINKRVLKLLGETYISLSRDNDALDTYTNLYNVNKSDYTVPLEIAKIYAVLQEYEQAYNWVEKAINISGGKGETYFQRAEVLFELAEFCSEEILSFEDKVVFEISYNDYIIAVQKGYRRAKARRDFVGENNITKSSDWFMRPESEREFTPKSACYKWVDRSIKRK
jgi:tetratricopeptide (TPR) repeat protein